MRTENTRQVFEFETQMAQLLHELTFPLENFRCRLCRFGKCIRLVRAVWETENENKNKNK